MCEHETSPGSWLGEERLNVVAYSHASTRIYLGSPSLVRLGGGAILFSHDYFGPGAPKNEHGMSNRSSVCRSEDDGATWCKLADIDGAWWSNLFVHDGAVYLFGVSSCYGDIVIRRSEDGGATWTEPVDSATGLLFAGGAGKQAPNYHCAPMPVLEHGGRLWRAFEDNDPCHWPSGFRASVISAPVDADLLRADSWLMRNKLRYDPESDPEHFGGGSGGEGWLEGNVVADPSGRLRNVMRVNSGVGDWGAILDVSADGEALSFDAGTGFFPMPGGHTKFTIRLDDVTKRYWTLANGTVDPNRRVRRQLLSLFSSPDLVHWDFHCRLLGGDEYDPERIGFQYVDWHFDGEDVIFACRTAWDGAHNFHDANHMTFHRIPSFRQISPQEWAGGRS